MRMLMIMFLFQGAPLVLHAEVASNGVETLTFPRYVTDIDGNDIDVEQLVRRKTVVVITLKATWCQVCQIQLRRLKQKLLLVDREKVTFLVLSPGPRDELNAIRNDTAFPYPFIEDQGLRIAKSIHLAIDQR